MLRLCATTGTGAITVTYSMPAARLHKAGFAAWLVATVSPIAVAGRRARDLASIRAQRIERRPGICLKPALHSKLGRCARRKSNPQPSDP